MSHLDSTQSWLHHQPRSQGFEGIRVPLKPGKGHEREWSSSERQQQCNRMTPRNFQSSAVSGNTICTISVLRGMVNNVSTRSNELYPWCGFEIPRLTLKADDASSSCDCEDAPHACFPVCLRRQRIVCKFLGDRQRNCKSCRPRNAVYVSTMAFADEHALI